MGGAAWAQPLPPAGQVNKDAQIILPPIEVNPVKTPSLPAPSSQADEALPSMLVKGFQFSGNTAISAEELQSLVAKDVNTQQDFAGLNRIADAISRHYRDKGYSVSRAYLPAQKSANGVIQINIIEGRLGSIQLQNTSAITDERLQKTLENNLCNAQINQDCADTVVEDSRLERTILTLKDLPGISVGARLSPGSKTGTSNLEVDIQNTKSNTYSLGLDNFGSIATGIYRINASADVSNLNHNGDQLSLGFATTTLTATKTGSASYTVPVGYVGQRVGLAFARSQYYLRGIYESAQAYGLSNALSAFTNYPIIRSANDSLYARLSAEVRGGASYIGAAGTSYTNNANVVRTSFSGEHAGLTGSFTSYGSTLSSGYIGNSDQLDAAAGGARSAGRFSKLSYALSHQQPIANGLALYGALNGQLANKNLNGSEQIGIGGSSSVRGYSGEAGGSVGANTTTELRYSAPFNVGDVVTYATYGLFVDRGWVQYYKTPPSGSTADNSRALSSYGLTLGLQSQPSPAWGYFLRGTYGRHAMDAASRSTVEPTSQGKFWLQSGVNF